MIALLGLFVLSIVLSQTHSWANVVALDWLEYTNKAINRKKKAIVLIRWTTWNWFLLLLLIFLKINYWMKSSAGYFKIICMFALFYLMFNSIYSVNVAFDRNQNHINTRNRLFLLAGLKQPLIQHMLLSSGTQKSCL